ncbi:hypothetical protein XELAEV_18013241mg [Xenopus laevis]|uniref:Uncharacterized protein n=1 Tax=Xenopus laevis TaxID=8355 RepID=A0A974HYZ0_XENLA|nr:hypothetical protein XELAEV_18013241mg [Xenopus laevis]
MSFISHFHLFSNYIHCIHGFISIIQHLEGRGSQCIAIILSVSYLFSIHIVLPAPLLYHLYKAQTLQLYLLFKMMQCKDFYNGNLVSDIP